MDTITPLVGKAFICKIPKIIIDSADLLEKGVLLECTVSDLNQLYQVFKWNLKTLNDLQIMSDDHIYDMYNNVANYYEVNAKTQNLFSAAKTLIDGIEGYLTQYTEKKKLFKKYTSQIFDDNYYYQLCQALRNYTQHGHLCVSQNADTFCFDLYQIIHTPHYDFKAKYRKLTETIINNCIQKYCDYPRVSYVLTLSEYVPLVIAIYRYYLELINDIANSVAPEYNSFINNNRNEINTCLIGAKYIPYKIENDECHLAPIRLEVNQYIQQYIIEVDKDLVDYESFQILKKTNENNSIE